MAVPRLSLRAKADGEPSELWKPFALAGAILIAVAGVLTTCAGPKPADSTANSGGSAFAASTVSSDALTRWYIGTQAIRQLVALDVAAIRTDLAGQNGTALQPVCSALADAVTEARALPPGPDSAAQDLFDGGLDGYGDGVAACGNLFDGTAAPVSTIQQRVKAGLTKGDAQWSALATRVGQPMATFSAPAPSAGVTPAAPPATGTPSASARPTSSAAARQTAAPTTPARQTTSPPPPATTPPPSPTAVPTSEAPPTPTPTATKAGILGA
ncbi:hypothetical protein [Pseudofrankia sp. DC12]|uniref:hypothetical protein n=1 Tax=Pseudofrankia sp. DC12 TaxID=683315 RepID=UPI000697761D|nr:hypothetical protein [Pseudofrankia sp. DC12]